MDPGTQLQVAPDGSGRDAFTQAGGLVAADGSMIIDGATFHFSGGALRGDFTVHDGWVRVDDTVTRPSTIDLVGHGNVLLDNAGAAVLRVQGGSPLGDGDAVLTAADASTNRGAIVLESLDGAHHGYFRVPTGRFTNEAGGVIEADLPPGESGAGSVTAGALEGDGGSVTDATGLPVDPQYQQALAEVQAALADGADETDLGDWGIDPATQLQALMARAPGVADDLIAVASLAGSYLPDGGLAAADGVFANLGAVSLA